MKHVLILLAVAALILSGCSDTIKGKSIAMPEVAKFHERLVARQFDAIYADAGPELKNVVAKEKMTELFAAIERKLGRFKSSKEASWKVNTYNLKTTVVLVQETEFERGTATETFTFIVDDGKAALAGYNINSWEMMVR